MIVKLAPPIRPAAAFLWTMSLALSMGACATNPVTGGADFVLMTEDEEIQLGRRNDPQVCAQFGVYDDAELQAYVQEVGRRVAAHGHRPGLVYRFTVLDTPDVNAFALPGGYIYITRGLLAYLNSEAELAAVLGHEIGHVTARHSVRQYSAATAGQILTSLLLRSQAGQDLFKVLDRALLSGYGRDQELEADRLGAQYLARTGYDPDAMTRVIGVLKNQEEFEKQRAQAEGRKPHNYHGVFASHPSADQRLQEVVAEAAKDKTTVATRLDRDTYLQHIDGVAYGDSAKAGIRRGSVFYHRDLNFAVRFPDGWSLQNTPDAVTARSPGGDAVMALRSDELDKRINPEAYLKTRLKVDELRDGAPLAQAPTRSYTALTTLHTPFGRRDTRVSAILRDHRAFLFLAAAKADAMARQLDDAFLATARSLHPLTSEERPLAEGLHLRVVPAAAGRTFADLARSSPMTNYAESVLRLLNDKFPAGEPAAGQPIKIIQ
jgi:predicted Zn-dependent protease